MLFSTQPGFSFNDSREASILTKKRNRLRNDLDSSRTLNFQGRLKCFPAHPATGSADSTAVGKVAAL